VRVSDSGLVTVTGGKLTTYRRMASDTVDRVVDALGTGGRCRTKRVRLVGAAGPTVSNEHLARRYGSLASDVLALETADPTLAEALVPGLPYRRSEAVYAVREEMARTLDDVLSRRTRARLLAREATARVADDVAALIGAELGWDATHIAREVGTFRSALAEERSAAGLPETALDESIGA
ncbi:MAG TPA: glycerol-3-phosphate dehydrogenase C-terminal domain-containing protein, partial [Acidimicrobiia bacterium]